MGRKKRVNTTAVLLADLSRQCDEKLAEIDALSKERERLLRRAAVVHAAVLHCNALAELAAIMSGGADTATSTSGSGGAVAASGTTGTAPRRGGGAAGGVSGGSSAAEPFPWASAGGGVNGGGGSGGGDLPACSIGDSGGWPRSGDALDRLLALSGGGGLDGAGPGGDRDDVTMGPPDCGDDAPVVAAKDGGGGDRMGPHGGASPPHGAASPPHGVPSARDWQRELRRMVQELGTAAAGGGGGDLPVGPAAAAVAAAAAPCGSAAGADGSMGPQGVGKGMVGAGGGRRGPVVLAVHWWPEGAAFVAQCAAGGESTAALRAAARDTLRHFGCLMPRITAGAPNAGACLERLSSVRARNFVSHAVLTISASPAVAEILLTPIDNDGSAAGAASLGGAAPGALGDAADGRSGGGSGQSGRREGSPEVQEAPVSHFVYALRQARLTEEQELIAAEVFAAWRARADALSARRDELLASTVSVGLAISDLGPKDAGKNSGGACGGGSGGEDMRCDGDAAVPSLSGVSGGPSAGGGAASGGSRGDGLKGARLLRALAAVQVAILVNLAVFSLVLYDSVMDVQQFATFALACWPHIPSFDHAASAHAAIQAEKQAAAAAAAANAQATARPAQQRRLQDGEGAPGRGAAAAVKAAVAQAGSGVDSCGAV